MRDQEGGATKGQEGNTSRGDATTSRRDEKPRRGCNKRTTRGDATSSRGNETTRRGRNKRMSRGDATTSRHNGLMRGWQRNERQRNSQLAQQEDKRAAWHLIVAQCAPGRDAQTCPSASTKGAGSKLAKEAGIDAPEVRSSRRADRGLV